MAPHLDTRPWYVRVEVRRLLRDCVAHMPCVVTVERRFSRSTDTITTFDPIDTRVAALEDIRARHLDALFEAQVESILIKEAGGLVTVDKAIDAVLPCPLAGNAGDPAYIASLPKIDLQMGRAAA